MYSPNPNIIAECWQVVEDHQHFQLLWRIYEGWRVGHNKSKESKFLFGMTPSPDVLWPIQGCRILQNTDTNQPYAMPIRALNPAIEQAVTDRDNPKAWCKYALDNKSLSYEQKIACIQRAVILDPNSPGFWWTLGCHFELEGKDWYGAANAFNHVIFLEPRSSGAWYSLARLWAGRGITSKAQEAYERFQQLQATEDAAGVNLDPELQTTEDTLEQIEDALEQIPVIDWDDIAVVVLQTTEDAAEQILDQARRWLVDLLTVQSDREPTEEEEELQANRLVKLMEGWTNQLQDPKLREAIQARLSTVAPMVRDWMIAVLKQAQERAEDSKK